MAQKEKNISESNVFKRMKKQRKSTEKSTEKILRLMRENQQITITEIANRLNLTTSAIEKQIAKLRKTNRVERAGGDKGGYWKVTETTDFP